MTNNYEANESYIRTYTDVIDRRVCKALIDTYEKVWKEQKDKIMSMSLCYDSAGNKTCGACNCGRLDLMQHEEFKELFNFVLGYINKTIQIYKDDCGITSQQWPSKFGYESFRIKRYLPDGVQQHDLHSDVTNKDSAKRFVSMVCYLNDDFKGGETTVPNFNYKSKVSTGAVMMFPTTWSYLHKGNPIKSGSGSPKYVLGTFLNYISGKKGYKDETKLL
jgi:hypothetical protein